MDNNEIDFDFVANELKQYTELSHDQIVAGLKAMQQRDRHWKNNSRFIVQLCGGKGGELNKKLLTVLIENTEYSRSHLFNFLKAGKILFNMKESDIEKIDCTIEEFLHKKDIAKIVDIYEIIKLGQYKFPWDETMYIYAGFAGETRDGTRFMTHGDISVESIQFTTKEKELDNKKIITTTTMVLDGIEYEIYKFDSNYKPWIHKTKN